MTSPRGRRWSPVGASTVAAALNFSLPALGDAPPHARAATSVLSVHRHDLDGMALLVNAISGAPSVAACLAWPSPPVTFSLRDERHLAERGGRLRTTRATGGSVDCVEVPASEVSLGLWLLANRLSQLLRTSAVVEATPGQPELELELDASARRRVGALSFVGAEPSVAHPSLPVLVVSGDVDADLVRTRAAQFFARVPRATAPGFVVHQTTERLNVVEDARAVRPAAHLGWLVPAGARAAADAAVTILAAGDTGRLDIELVRRRRSADRVDAFSEETSGSWLVGISVHLAPHATVDRVQRFVDGALLHLRAVGPNPAELLRAKRTLVAGALVALQHPLGRARLLAEAALVDGDAKELAALVEAYSSLTALQIRDAARRLLVSPRRNVVEVYPPKYAVDDPKLAGFDLYTVDKADTWRSVSARFGLPAAVIAADNDLDPKHRLSPGQPLWIRPR